MSTKRKTCSCLRAGNVFETVRNASLEELRLIRSSAKRCLSSLSKGFWSWDFFSFPPYWFTGMPVRIPIGFPNSPELPHSIDSLSK